MLAGGNKTEKLVIVGARDYAEIAYEYFTYDSPYEVVAFAVERAYIEKDSLFGLPVLPLEDLTSHCPPDDHKFHVAATYGDLNRLRTRLCDKAKAMNYKPASYVSSKAFVWRNVRMGEHCFIFEDNTVQPFVQIGNNVVLWSGNHIGHHSTIGDNCFISSHVVLSGHTQLGRNCFVGVNATLGHNLKVGDNCLIGAGAVVLGDIPDDKVVTGLWKRDKARKPSQRSTEFGIVVPDTLD